MISTARQSETAAETGDRTLLITMGLLLSSAEQSSYDPLFVA